MNKNLQKLFIRAAMGEPVERTPLWIMRQAGRYLPEYHKTKEQAGGFMGLCKIPEYGIEVTMQPILRFGFDAAILFSDILIPAEAMGLHVGFNPGPMVANPVESARDADALIVPEPEEKMPYVLEILKGLKTALPASCALIGFAGAPYTVASYMVCEQHSKGPIEIIRKMVYGAPEVLATVIDKIIQTTLKYLRAQITAGAEAVQLFDSSAWQLPPHLFKSLALSPVKIIVDGLKDTGVPVIYFAPGAMASLDAMKDPGADVIGVDWRIGLDRARCILGDHLAVQGNLDPAVLFGTKEAVKRETLRILKENDARPGHIFNLGHGILPETPIENVETLVAAVQEGSSR